MVEKSADISPYPANVGSANPSRAEQQMTKMKDTNAKYKSLLKMAKERIQTQEDEKESLRCEFDYYLFISNLCKSSSFSPPPPLRSDFKEDE
jgi:hypothetical protein